MTHEATSESRSSTYKPKVGITLGDFNGIGPEIVIKVLEDKRITTLCTPIIYGSGKILTRYKRLLELENFNYHQYNENSYLNEKKVNVVNCWQDHLTIEPGKVTEEAGLAAYLALQKSTEDLKSGFIDAVVTCPINKANVKRKEFPYAGHTEYYAKEFEAEESLMMLCSSQLKVGLVTVHVPLHAVSRLITRERIQSKVIALMASLKKDFGISKPKIAVLGLNPHAGEEGLLGQEEQEIISPAIIELHKKGNLVYGPYPADGFFGMMMHQKFDAVLAMYHDQGLIPFKALAFDEGVNFTAGLSIVRTSPDHGTAYSIAGKGIANERSFREALYMAIDVVRHRRNKIENKIRLTKKLKFEQE